MEKIFIEEWFVFGRECLELDFDITKSQYFCLHPRGKLRIPYLLDTHSLFCMESSWFLDLQNKTCSGSLFLRPRRSIVEYTPAHIHLFSRLLSTAVACRK